MKSLEITGSVGVGGQNRPSDVKAVQAALNQLIHLLVPFRHMAENGKLGTRADQCLTLKAIQEFQRRVVHMRLPSCEIEVNGASHAAINAQLRLLTSPAKTPAPEPPWMVVAKAEIGQAEVSGAKANPRILEYFKSAKFWGTDDSGGANAWCASFVAWVMEQSGYKGIPGAYRAKSWAAFGKPIKDPVYGAIGIKTRGGGGHVAFVVGKSADGRSLYMLGGNQDDALNIKKYPLGVWKSFHLPADYAGIGASLPVYSGAASAAGAED